MLVPAAPPLVPSPDDARASLRRELLDPAYQELDPVQALLDWLRRVLGRGLDAASGAPAVSTLVAMLLLLLLVGSLVWLASRTRRTAAARRDPGAVLTDEAASAEDLRARAEQAMTVGRYAEAVVDGFRALARRQVERGLMADDPGATAREVAGVLGAAGHRDPAGVAAAAGLFDGVLYGGLPVTEAQARAVLALDDVPAGRR